MAEKIKPQDKPHYVNNKEFSLAVVDYCNRLQKAQKQKSTLGKLLQTGFKLGKL